MGNRVHFDGNNFLDGLGFEKKIRRDERVRILYSTIPLVNSHANRCKPCKRCALECSLIACSDLSGFPTLGHPKRSCLDY